MNEALYRGKRTDTGEWVEGYLLQAHIIVPAGQGVNYSKYNGRNLLTCDSVLDFFIVDPETVGQYVRNDVNGRQAFEGDIIKNDLGDEVGVIRFGEYRNTMNDDGHACHVGFYVEWHGGRAAKCLRKDVGYWLNYHPIAGNVYDNPELLEVK